MATKKLSNGFTWDVTYKTYKARVRAHTYIGAKKAACKIWGKDVCSYEDSGIEAFIDYGAIEKREERI